MQNIHLTLVQFDIQWEDAKPEKKEEERQRQKTEKQKSNTKFKIEWDKDTLK